MTQYWIWIDQSHFANWAVLPNVIGQFEIQYCVFGQATWNLRYTEEVQQDAGPDVIWRLADAAWLHSFRVWTLHCLYLGLYLDHAYLYLRLYLRGTVHCLLAYCLVNPRNWSLWWKLGGTAMKKPQVWSQLALYKHVIISFMAFWPLSDLLCHVRNAEILHCYRLLVTKHQ